MPIRQEVKVETKGPGRLDLETSGLLWEYAVDKAIVARPKKQATHTRKTRGTNTGYKLYSEMVYPAGSVPTYLFGEGGNDAINPIPSKNPSRHWDWKHEMRVSLLDTCQYLAVSTFKKCKGKRTQTIDNVDRTYANFLDLDGPTSEGEIKQRIKDLELPLPTFIIRTSPGRFHVLWYLQVPINAGNPKEIRTWERVQTMLHFAFADLGSDVAVVHDRTRFLRNPYAVGLENRKYCSEKGVSKVIVETVFFTGKPTNSILGLYLPLCEAGYRKFLGLRNRWHPKVREDLRQLRAFRLYSYIKLNSTSQLTQQELSCKLGMPPSALKLLLNLWRGRKTLRTGVVGRWDNRRTAYFLLHSQALQILKSYMKEYRCSNKLVLSKDHTAPDDTNSAREAKPPPWVSVLSACNQTQVIRGRRNRATYCMGVSLRASSGRGATFEQALSRVVGFIRLNEADDFREAEIKKALKSGWDAPQGFNFKPTTPYWLGFREVSYE